MISAWWLFLIVPASVWLGFCICAFMVGADDRSDIDNDSDKKEHF